MISVWYWFRRLWIFKEIAQANYYVLRYLSSFSFQPNQISTTVPDIRFYGAYIKNCVAQLFDGWDHGLFRFLYSRSLIYIGILISIPVRHFVSVKRFSPPIISSKNLVLKVIQYDKPFIEYINNHLVNQEFILKLDLSHAQYT